MKTIILFLRVACGSALQAQQVVATAGGTFSNSSGYLSYTIGEGVAQTLTKGNKTITQGFQQTTLSVTTVSELKELDFSITAYPNPVSDILKIRIDKKDVTGLQYLLFDMTGKLISGSNLEGAETNVPFDKVQSGTYLIKVQAGTKELKTFKIIKLY